MKRINKISFFESSKIKGEKIGQIMIDGVDHIIKVPEKLQKLIRIGVSYDIEVTPLFKGRGFMLKRFMPHEDVVKITLSSNRRELTVIVDEEEKEEYGFKLDKEVRTPYQKYSDRKFTFMSEVSSNSGHFSVWKAGLQDISNYHEFDDWPDGSREPVLITTDPQTLSGLDKRYEIQDEHSWNMIEED